MEGNECELYSFKYMKQAMKKHFGEQIDHGGNCQTDKKWIKVAMTPTDVYPSYSEMS